MEYLDTKVFSTPRGQVKRMDQDIGARVKFEGRIGTLAQSRQSGSVGFRDYSGLEALLEAMVNSRTVTSLNLSDNDLGDFGTDMVHKALLDHGTMQRIGLANNHISDHGASLLCNCMTSPKLQAVALTQNEFGLEIAMKLANQAKKGKISLCGIKQEQTDFECVLGASDVFLLTNDLTMYANAPRVHRRVRHRCVCRRRACGA